MCKTAFMLTLTSLQIQVKVTKKLYFLHAFSKMGDSAKNASHICRYFVSGNNTIIVDVQHTFSLTLILQIQSRSQAYLRFSACLLYNGWYFVYSTWIASHIYTYLIPVSCIIIADVQHTFCFDHNLFEDSSQSHTQHQISLNFKVQGSKHLSMLLMYKYTKYNDPENFLCLQWFEFIWFYMNFIIFADWD